MNKYWYWAGGIAIALLIIYLVFKRQINGLFQSDDSDVIEEGGGGQTVSLDRNKVLSKGSKGSEVRELQRLLNTGGASLSVDGDFGAMTEGALMKQKGVKSTSLNGFGASLTVIEGGLIDEKKNVPVIEPSFDYQNFGYRPDRFESDGLEIVEYAV